MRRDEFPWTEADAMYLLLIRRAVQLRSSHSDPVYEQEFDCLWNAIDAYEAKRWDELKEPPSEAA
jgi:hypothetical protein